MASHLILVEDGMITIKRGQRFVRADMLMLHLGYCGEIWAQSLWAGKWQKSLIRDLLSH